MKRRVRSEMATQWARQAAILASAAIVVFWGFYAFDFFTAGGHGGLPGMFAHYLRYDGTSVTNPVSTFSGVNSAVFGIVITVVSIIVQLTADRYTGVARMFLRDPVNIGVSAYFVVSCVVSVWLSTSLHDNYIPRATVTMVLSLTTGSLVIMAPYFSYVFWFLEPENIVARIRKQAIILAHRGAKLDDEAESFADQERTLSALEELTDVANNSISGQDKIVASAAVDSLKDFALDYLKEKPDARPSWFLIGPEIKLNPDFVAMDPTAVTDLEKRRTWVEWKVMRQFLSIYNEALGSMRDINYLIAIDTRYIGEAAAEAKDEQLIELVYRYMNSYIRTTLNAGDVRTAYNVLNQYRKLVESMLRVGNGKAALTGVKHMKYYGLVSFERELRFITETVAYDLAQISQIANELSSTAEQGILNEFLELDRPPFVRGQEMALLGVRKAQTKLAAFYLSTGQEDRARAIANDMRNEPEDRLRTIFHQLGAVENEEFWEIVDRGKNFDYMPVEQRACLGAFFAWLNIEASTQPPPA